MIAGITLGGLLLMPPAQGQMMLIPLTTSAARALPALALQGETRLIATGPLPGSLVVYGRRSTIMAAMMRHATLTLASPPGGCSAAKTAT